MTYVLQGDDPPAPVDAAKLVDAVENLLICIWMGWDLGEAVDAVVEALPDNSPCKGAQP